MTKVITKRPPIEPFTETFNKAKPGTIWEVQIEEEASELFLVAKITIYDNEADSNFYHMLDLSTMAPLEEDLTIISYREVNTVEISIIQ